MFFPVTVYAPDGEIKEVISSKTLEKRHWSEFWKIDKSRSFSNKTKKQTSQWLKEKLDLKYFDLEKMFPQ